MAVTSREIKREERKLLSDFGQIDAAMVRDVFIRVVHVAAWLLILLSAVGTFYALQAQRVPLPDVFRIVVDVARAPDIAILAAAAQAVLGVTQWGARLFAYTDRKWWVVYLASLWISATLNWNAYAPTLALWNIPAFFILIIILAGDVFPELVLIRREEG